MSATAPSIDCLAATAYQRGKLPRHELDMLDRPYPFQDYPGPVPLPVLEKAADPAAVEFWECFTGSSTKDSAASFTENSAKRITGNGAKNTLKSAAPAAQTPGPEDNPPVGQPGATLAQLAAIAHLAAGITRPAKSAHANLRAWASAGALYPCELYFSLAGALYHYTPFSGVFSGPALHPLPCSKAALPQNPAFFISARSERTRWKYKERACRYTHLDAGHLAANLELACRAAGLDWQRQDDKTASLIAEAVKLHQEEETPALFTCPPLSGQPQPLPQGRTQPDSNSYHALSAPVAPELPPTLSMPLGAVLHARRSQRVFSGAKLAEADSVKLLEHLLPQQAICSAHTAAEEAEKTAIAAACLDQNFSAKAALHVVLWAEQPWLDPQNYHLALQEAGRAGQRLYLAASAMNIAVCGMAAFYDAELAQAANLPKGAAPLYVLACG